MLPAQAFDVGKWGVTAIVNAPSDGSFLFKDDLEFHCKEAVGEAGAESRCSPWCSQSFFHRGPPVKMLWWMHKYFEYGPCK
jgi:hypothetical protein